MAIKQLHCYCDHCANNTCQTNQLCYAEWRLVMSTNEHHHGQQQQSQSTFSSLSTALLASGSSPASESLQSSEAIAAAATATTTSTSTTTQTTTPTILSQASHHLGQQLTPAGLSMRLERSYNCYKKDEPLLMRAVCNATASNTAHVIRNCCGTGDYCNKDPNLLPSREEAFEQMRKFLPAFEPSQLKQHEQQHGTNNIFAEFIDQYSSLPLGLQITLILLTLLLLAYIIALAQNRTIHRSRRHHSQRSRGRSSQQHAAVSNQSTNAFKRVLNRLLFNFSRQTDALFGSGRHRYGNEGGGGDDGDAENQRRHLRSQGISETRGLGGGGGVTSEMSRTRGTVHHIPSPKGAAAGTAAGSSTAAAGAPMGQRTQAARPSASGHHQLEDFSEYSSSKANSDMTMFDNNSMASREPLIGGGQPKQMHIHPGSSHPYQAPLNHQHPGPYMADETFNGRTQTAFQMTLGSAAGLQFKQDASSGSGAGQPYLTQRSIAHDIELCEVVGRGFFGVVWRGDYKGEPVAVKIFSPVAEPSWEREAEIYQTTMLRHKNILGFIATDKRHDAALTGYWLVTDYYAMGSLYDFLKDNTMSMSDAIRMAFSIANGLSHLHIEIFGTRGKPAIAHRDMKSKNILVKNDGTCCIADLGMAVRYNSNTGIVDVPTNTRIGTRRYLAPETLENKLNLMDFESVKATDIYALGLVLWEILRRACLAQTDVEAYGHGADAPLQQQQQQPYQTLMQPSTPARRVDRPGPDGTSGSGALPPSTEAPLLQAGPAGGPGVELGDLSPPPPGQQQQQQPPPPPQQQRGMRQAPPHHQSFMTNESLDSEEASSDLICEPYEAPYQPYVPLDPTAEEMREIVCVRKIRPELSARWSKYASMRDYVTLMTECWYDKPQSRLSALRVRKSLSDVARKYFSLNMEYD